MHNNLSEMISPLLSQDLSGAGLRYQSEKTYNRGERRIYWTEKLAVQELNTFLLEVCNEGISTARLKEKKRGLYNFFLRNYPNESGKINWRLILPMMSEGARAKLRVSRNINTAIEELEMIVAKADSKVTPEYVKTSSRYLYKFLLNNFKDEFGSIDWFLICGKLPSKLRKKFIIPCAHIKRKIINKLNHVFTVHDCVITPQLLAVNYRSLSSALRAYFPDKNGLADWFFIHKRIKHDFAPRFVYRRTRSSALKELNELLKTRNPSQFNSRYIKQADSNLFAFLRGNFKDSRGYIDWKFIVNNLCNELRVKFKYPVRHNRSTPCDVYEDIGEIKSCIGEKKFFLYTFLSTSSKDFEKRDEICLILSKLAKKGNKTAEAELLKMMEFLIDGWVERAKNFNWFKYHQETLGEIVRRCIYNFREVGPFVGYVFKSLQMAALGLEKFREVSFDDGIKYSKYVY